MNDYQPIIGLEIHVELKTRSKMFCGCKNDPFHAPKPNMYTCPVCLGLPGALPVANKKAVEWTIMLGLALGCEIPELSKFDRKNYFYPDIPKGYQISQYDKPLAINGQLVISNEVRNLGNKVAVNDLRFARSLANARDDNKDGKKTIRIQRVHLEEDTGKLQHATVNGKKVSLIDFNRSGVPLIEIVTEPDIRSSDEAKAFLTKLHKIVTKLNISDAEMDKGSMRMEPNISVKKVDSSQLVVGSDSSSSEAKGRVEKLPNYKVEVKNINSFNFVKKAIDYEVGRHIEILERGETPKQETRGWDEHKNVTFPQRSKEEAQDYRYFPDPDLPPMKWTQSQISNLKSQIPELPDQVELRFVKDYNFPITYAEMASGDTLFVEFIDQAISIAQKQTPKLTPKTIGDWIFNKKVDYTKITPEELVKIIKAAKTVVYVDEKELDTVIKKVLTQNSKAVADYRSGKTGVIMFLVGQVMKELKGKGDAKVIKEVLEETLK